MVWYNNLIISMTEPPSSHSSLGSQLWSYALESCWLAASSLGSWGPLGGGQEGREYILEQWLFICKYINIIIFANSVSVEYLIFFSPSPAFISSPINTHNPDSIQASSHICHTVFYIFHFIHGFLVEDFASSPCSFLSLFWLEGLTEIFLFLEISILTLLNDFFPLIFLKKENNYFYILKVFLTKMAQKVFFSYWFL